MKPLIFDDNPGKKPNSPRVAFISSYVPRKCGIATFTRDLAQSVDAITEEDSSEVVALMDSLSENLPYPSRVVFKVRQKVWADYQKAALLINKSSADMVCLQHEYGIYGGDYGNFVLPLIDKIKKPIIATLHTVVPKPDKKHLKITRSLCRRSSFVVVMLEEAARILSQKYRIPPSNIIVIPHGVPNFSNFTTQTAKEKLGLSGKTVMTSINLLSHYKGVEYAIKSLPEIVKKVPNFIYQIVGETHPDYLRQMGGVDTYRQGLQALARRLGVSPYIRFVNKYISLEELVGFIEATDFYVTPYIDPGQITSGALAYAVGAGKVCISTPYLYAKEMLSGGRGIIVPFAGSGEIARAVINLAGNPEQMRQHQQKTYRVGKLMTWPYVASQYLELFNLVKSRAKSAGSKAKSLVSPQGVYLDEDRQEY